MADLRPFKAMRPKPESAAQVAALPYDVLSVAEAAAQAKDNPLSFLHVDKPEIDLPESQQQGEPLFAKARENYQRLVHQQILVSDPESYYYIYSQIWQGAEQTGLVSVAAVSDYLEGRIKPHEKTRVEKQEERRRHILACHAQTGPAFLFYRENPALTEMLESWKSSHDPIFSFRGPGEVLNQGWVINDGTALKTIINLTQEIPEVFIADGHHRTAAAVEIGKDELGNLNSANENSKRYFLSVLFPDTQLRILPYHRIVRNLSAFDAHDFLEKLAVDFEVKPLTQLLPPERSRTFSLALKNESYELRIKNDRVPLNDAVASLDVSLLQKYVFEKQFKIVDPRTDPRLSYVGGIRPLTEIQEQVKSGKANLALLVNKTCIEDVMKIAHQNQTLPPKSTWFEPKLLSGLFIHSF